LNEKQKVENGKCEDLIFIFHFPHFIFSLLNSSAIAPRIFAGKSFKSFPIIKSFVLMGDKPSQPVFARRLATE